MGGPLTKPQPEAEGASGYAAHVIGRLLGSWFGPTQADADAWTGADKFSQWLQLLDYDEDQGLYYNNDDTIGAIWMGSPVYLAGEKTANCLKSLFKQGFMHGAALNVTLHGDPDIRHITNRYRERCVLDDPVLRSITDEYARFYERASREGFAEMSGLPARDGKLVISLKLPFEWGKRRRKTPEDLLRLISLSKQKFADAGVNPVDMQPRHLLAWLRDLLAPDAWIHKQAWDRERYLRDQVLKEPHTVEKRDGHLKIGPNHWMCITPAMPPQPPAQIEFHDTRELVGKMGLNGEVPDGGQIYSPFLYSTTVYFDEGLKGELRWKSYILNRGRSKGDADDVLADRQKGQVYKAAADAEEGGQFAYLRVFPQLWVYGPDHGKVSGDLGAAESAVWATKGWEMQRDDQMLLPLFLSALPFGYLPGYGNLNKIDRHWNASEAAAKLLPVQFDCSGGHDAMEMYAGRNGQVVTVDQWNPGANNHNSFTVAEPGAGKSVSENCKAIRYHAAGFQQVVVEAGNSFRPLVKYLKGTHVVVEEGSRFCVNPFSRFKVEEGDDAIDDAEALAGVMINMAYSSVKKTPEVQIEITILKKAIRWAWKEAGPDANIGLVRTYLKEYPKHYLEKGEWGSDTLDRWKGYAHDLALNIADFCPGGVYGRFFNGKTTLDVESSQFTVIELDGLLNRKALFKVMMLIIMDNISKVVYLGDRSQKKKIKVDEFHVLLKAGVHNIEDFFEQLFRRFRKHGGGIDIITQGILDFEKDKFGPLGDIIMNYSAFKYYLQCGDYQTAKERKVVFYDDLVMGLLKGVNSRKGFYSETMVDFGQDRFLIYRNVLPDYMKLMFTTDSREVSELKKIEAEIVADPSAFGFDPDAWVKMERDDRERHLVDLRIKECLRRRKKGF